MHIAIYITLQHVDEEVIVQERIHPTIWQHRYHSNSPKSIQFTILIFNEYDIASDCSNHIQGFQLYQCGRRTWSQVYVVLGLEIRLWCGVSVPSVHSWIPLGSVYDICVSRTIKFFFGILFCLNSTGWDENFSYKFINILKKSLYKATGMVFKNSRCIENWPTLC